MSTCSEVLSGLYGITLTGYIFFADRFKDTSQEDESLSHAVEALLLLCLCTFNMILYFVISVPDPHKVKRISGQKMDKLSKDTNPGDVDEFRTLWNEIEKNLYVLKDELTQKLQVVPGSGRRQPQMVQTLALLRNYGRIHMNLWRKLDKLRQYHNLSLHDVNMGASQEMCDLAKDVLAELKTEKRNHI